MYTLQQFTINLFAPSRSSTVLHASNLVHPPSGVRETTMLRSRPTVCTLETREYCASPPVARVFVGWVTTHPSNFKSFFWPGIRLFDGGTRMLFFCCSVVSCGRPCGLLPPLARPQPSARSSAQKPETGANSHRISSYDITTLQALPHAVRTLEAHKCSSSPPFRRCVRLHGKTPLYTAPISSLSVAIISIAPVNSQISLEGSLTTKKPVPTRKNMHIPSHWKRSMLRTCQQQFSIFPRSRLCRHLPTGGLAAWEIVFSKPETEEGITRQSINYTAYHPTQAWYTKDSHACFTRRTLVTTTLW